MIFITYKDCIKTALLKTDCEESDFDKNMFPILANEAQLYIAKYGTHIVRTAEFTADSIPYRAKLPDDFYRIALRGMVRKDDELSGADCFLAEDGCIVINQKGDFKLYYYALPKDLTKLTDEELDTYEFEVADHTQVAIPLYVGYQLVKSDDVQTAQILMDEWNGYMALFDDGEKVVYKRI